VKRLPVDLSELAALIDQPARGPSRAFLDRESGALETMPREAEVEGVFDDIVAAPERWVEIHPLRAADRQQLRRRFVDEEVTDPHLRLRLGEALGGERPFTRFEAVLRDRPGLIDRWLEFRGPALTSLIVTWLSALGIEPQPAPRDEPWLRS
jgi:hypothetical protein